MSKTKLIVVAVLGLLLVVVVALWSGRTHENDSLLSLQFDPSDHAWTESLDGAAASIGGVFGIGAERFDLSRLQIGEGPLEGCDRETCRHTFTGFSELHVRQDADAPFAKLWLSSPSSVSVAFAPGSEDLNPRTRKNLSGDERLKLTILEEGGPLAIWCPTMQATCGVLFEAEGKER